MASWANPDDGLCPECGHTNSRQWLLCDKCGARLPWAPPEGPRKGLNDLTDEQLAAVFRPPPEPPRRGLSPGSLLMMNPRRGCGIGFLLVWLVVRLLARLMRWW